MAIVSFDSSTAEDTVGYSILYFVNQTAIDIGQEGTVLAEIDEDGSERYDVEVDLSGYSTGLVGVIAEDGRGNPSELSNTVAIDDVAPDAPINVEITY